MAVCTGPAGAVSVHVPIQHRVYILHCPETVAVASGQSKNALYPSRVLKLSQLTAVCLAAQGKTLLLITNSDFTYTNKMMSYAYDEYLPEGKTWRDLFDMVRNSTPTRRR